MHFVLQKAKQSCKNCSPDYTTNELGSSENLISIIDKNKYGNIYPSGICEILKYNSYNDCNDLVFYENSWKKRGSEPKQPHAFYWYAKRE